MKEQINIQIKNRYGETEHETTIENRKNVAVRMAIRYLNDFGLSKNDTEIRATKHSQWWIA